MYMPTLTVDHVRNFTVFRVFSQFLSPVADIPGDSKGDIPLPPHHSCKISQEKDDMTAEDVSTEFLGPLLLYVTDYCASYRFLPPC